MTDKEIKIFFKFLKETNIYGQFKKVLKNDCYVDNMKSQLNYHVIKDRLRSSRMDSAITSLIMPDCVAWNTYKQFTLKEVNIPRNIMLYYSNGIGKFNWRDISNVWYRYYTQIEGKNVYDFFKKLINSQKNYLYINAEASKLFKFDLTNIDLNKEHVSHAILTTTELSKNLTVKTHKNSIASFDQMYVSNCSFKYFLKHYEPITIESAKDVIEKFRETKMKNLEKKQKRKETI